MCLIAERRGGLGEGNGEQPEGRGPGGPDAEVWHQARPSHERGGGRQGETSDRLTGTVHLPVPGSAQGKGIHLLS